ncbi:MAG: NAD(P)/FAD-dependent oxidoreductase [Candidatus Latescibacteria bacterium]|nr:NAD(P)/FAD-dependent oxidoreductase [Candidatus Latescibacterota bacterium]
MEAPVLQDRYDVIIIGSGMAGLTCGAMAAQAGLSVLVAEKHGKLGGYVQYFGKEFMFDSTLHLLGGCGPGSWIGDTLRRLGIADRLEFVKLDPAYRCRIGENEVDIPSDPSQYDELLGSRFPFDRGGLRRVCADMATIGREGLDQSNGLVARYADKTAQTMLDEYVRDRRLHSLICALWPLYGLPPSRLSAAHFAMAWATYHAQGGTSFLKGGAKALSDAIASAIQEAGGQVVTKTRVTHILVEQHSVAGILLEDGRTIRARAVVSNADPHQTWLELVGQEHIDEEWRVRLETWQPSVSAVEVHLGVEMPLDVGFHTCVFHDTDDFEVAYQDIFADQPSFPSMVVTVTTKSDPGRAPAGQHQVILMGLADYGRADAWGAPGENPRDRTYRAVERYQHLKETIGSRMIAKAERLIPGLSEHAFIRKVGTPLTMERYTFNHRGAAYGWANIPSQSGAYRPGPTTSTAGLYLCGHWTFPGGGVAAAIVSGRRAAEAIMEK